MKMLMILKYLLSPKVYYFAYGSNMSYKRLSNRIGYCQKIGIGKLYGYKLCFNYGPKDQSFANIKEAALNDFVYGVLYKVTKRQLAILDYYEGAGHPDYYTRIKEFVNKKVVNTYIAFKTRDELERPVKTDYLNHLLIGAKENNLLHLHYILQKYIQ